MHHSAVYLVAHQKAGTGRYENCPAARGPLAGTEVMAATLRPAVAVCIWGALCKCTENSIL